MKYVILTQYFFFPFICSVDSDGITAVDRLYARCCRRVCELYRPCAWLCRKRSDSVAVTKRQAIGASQRVSDRVVAGAGQSC